MFCNPQSDLQRQRVALKEATNVKMQQPERAAKIAQLEAATSELTDQVVEARARVAGITTLDRRKERVRRSWKKSSSGCTATLSPRKCIFFDGKHEQSRRTGYVHAWTRCAHDSMSSRAYFQNVGEAVSSHQDRDCGVVASAHGLVQKRRQLVGESVNVLRSADC